MIFYSQQNEDRILFEKYLNYKNGTFIELGAMDGVLYSNSLFFEKELDWNGILIEPTNQYESLIKNRPNCYNFNYAISEFDGVVEFVGSGALGGIKDSMPNGHLKGWGLDKELTYKVESKPISNVIRHLNIDRVDLFSIDVEGGELEVLRTFDWNIPVYIVLIEMAKYESNKDEDCRKFLISKGFEFDSIIGCNEVWINKNNKINNENR
jgi:FkbM family methyltransferase